MNIWVNGSYVGTNSDGSIERPFKTYAEAIEFASKKDVIEIVNYESIDEIKQENTEKPAR